MWTCNSSLQCDFRQFDGPLKCTLNSFANCAKLNVYWYCFSNVALGFNSNSKCGRKHCKIRVATVTKLLLPERTKPFACLFIVSNQSVNIFCKRLINKSSTRHPKWRESKNYSEVGIRTTFIMMQLPADNKNSFAKLQLLIWNSAKFAQCVRKLSHIAKTIPVLYCNVGAFIRDITLGERIPGNKNVAVSFERTVGLSHFQTFRVSDCQTIRLPRC